MLCSRRTRFVTLAAALCLASAGVAADEQTARLTSADVENNGFAKLLCASPLGSEDTDRLVGSAVLDAKTLLVAGNRSIQHLRGRKRHARSGNGKGFLAVLSITGDRVRLADTMPIEGQVNQLTTGPDGRVYMVVDGRSVYRLSADGRSMEPVLSRRGIQDVGIDTDGSLVVLAGRKLHRYGPAGQGPLWTASWKTYGGNRPGGVAVDPETGVAVVVGYGMAHTGREPWKDPYAFAYDREGRQVWKLWHPKPSRQVSARHGGNGLMADTTGKFAVAGPEGRVYLCLYADGGNSVCTRNPDDPDKPIDPSVFRGVFQKGPGYGFKGASSTAVLFRVHAGKGRVEKGTWMCAWLSRQRANGLGMDAAAGDDKGNLYVVGGSASGCPTRRPWLGEIPGYRGGGYLAIFGPSFQMRQCGYFQRTDLHSVAVGHGLVVAAGACKPGSGKDDEDPIWVHHPLRDEYAGGQRDGYVLVFRAGR